MYIKTDPYANAFNKEANGAGHITDLPKQGPWVWERKYEIDSLCYPIRLLYLYWKQTGKEGIIRDDLEETARIILDVWETEQYHHEKSPYLFIRENTRETDTIHNGGKGSPVAYTGMTWSGFRPSDDRCLYNYLVPSNMMAVCALKKAAEMASIGYEDTKLESECRSLAFDIDEGIKEYGVIDNERYGKMFAYETDGKGNYVLMDDANSPSLLAAPYLGYIKADNELYKNTRSFVLSNDNPWYFEGRAAKGVGSPHTGIDKIWHIALSMQALTSSNPEEIKECINMLTTTDAGTKLMHESFYKHDATDFTRPWFAWSNSLFAELLIRIAEGKIGY
jgi:meiotically up-regulated gene 157 (Mug157) protein